MAINGLRKYGIYPFDSNVFSDYQFQPASTIDYVTGDDSNLVSRNDIFSANVTNIVPINNATFHVQMLER